MIDSNILKKLERILLKGSPILFTGAGFSKFAHNSENELIPDGCKLKDRIVKDLLLIDDNEAEYKELYNSSLSDLCSYCESEVGKNKLRDFLAQIFSGCRPERFHKVIANFPWKKVYSTNIDDLFENSRDKGVAVQNLDRMISFTKAKSLEYIKLHGCVRNPSGEIVFSKQDYIDSMMHSRDYRFNSFAQDMQRENFIFLGFEMDEINLDYYLELYKSVSGHSANGVMFFIKPNPGLVFKSKIAKVNGYVIDWTTEQFAKYLNSINKKELDSSADYKIDGFRFLENVYSAEITFKGYNSDLYFGKTPIWKDVFFDWDFINPQIEQTTKRILYLTQDNNRNLIASLVGKAISGKSVYLKRIGLSLLKEGFVVYDFVDRKFDYWDFLQHCKKLSETKFALLVDNASFFYSALKNLLNKFPIDKQIVIVTSSRPYFHNRKRYNLISEYNFLEIYLGQNVSSLNRDKFSMNIATKLDEKGFLGSLKAYSLENRVKYIYRKNDVASLLYTITFGNEFVKREIDLYEKILRQHNSDEIDVLKILAIFQKMDLPYLPLELLVFWYGSKCKTILNNVSDLVNVAVDSNGLYLRNNILTRKIILGITPLKRAQLLKDVLVFVSPQISDTIHSYWNEIQSTLMKVKLLRLKLKMKNSEIKNLLFDIKKYYNEEFNYWLQVGLVEQSENDFEKALNRFRQADALSNDSYVVQNAIARNYLRYANYISNREKAMELFEEGRSRMLKLIDNRDEYQVKAFSTHCYIFEQIRFWKKYSIVPTKKELEALFGLLKSILKVDQNDPMAKHISNLLFKFIHESKVNNLISIGSNYDLEYLKDMFADYSSVNIAEMLEDFEID